MAVEGNPAAPVMGFTVGGVLAATFSTLFTNIIRFVAIIVIVSVPVIAFAVGGGLLLSGDFSTTGLGFNFNFASPNALQILYTVSMLVLGGLSYLLVVSALIHGALQHLAGRPVSIGGCLAAGLSALPRVFGASLLLVIVGILLGLMAALAISTAISALFWVGLLLVNLVPSLLVLMVFARILVFIPAIMVERAGVLESFGRSQELTREHRWGIFGILLMITLANWIIPFASLALSSVSPAASAAFDIAFAVFFIALVSVLVGVVYHALRSGKEGAPVGEVAKVFD